MQKKQILFFGILDCLLIALVAGVVVAGHHRSGQSDKIQVTASFYPMAEFARQVGGDKVAVNTLVKPGVEPHDYDPSPQDLVGLYQSKLFVYNGAGLEKWTDRIQKDLASNHVTAVRASDGIQLLAPFADDEEGSGAATDPHVWLDPMLAIKEVTAIKDGLVKIDPANQTYYEAHAQAFTQQLTDLDTAYKNGLQQCQRRDIVTSHQAFRYLAQQYNLTSVSISGLSPDDEPSPQKLADVAQFAKAHDVQYIFFESLASPKLSQTIASEVGAKTLVFNPLEGLTDSDIALGKNYLSVQKENLQNLRTALDCK
ncbi:MAG TPA: metal ABC transporter substrate-binding protein [Candidatus Saccharimonadales bacterium]|nr:metal ABC transporter substrate-binding protein [Candidatus Saccharimonadales bacterium]